MEFALETEFEIIKSLHRYAILKARIMKYYQDLEANRGGVDIPSFMRTDSPEKLADRDIKNILQQPNGEKTFCDLYERAYQELALVGDF